MKLLTAILLVWSAQAQTTTNGSANIVGPLGIQQQIQFQSVTAPATNLTATGGSAGNVSGAPLWCVSFVTIGGETEVGPPDGSGSHSCVGATAGSLTSQQVNLTNIPVSTDRRVIGRNIYRATGASNFYYRLTAGTTIADNTTTVYTDNIAAPVSVDPIPRGVVNTTSGLFYWGSTPVGFIGNGTTVYGSAAALNLANSTLSPVGNFTTVIGWGAMASWDPAATSQYNTAVGGGALGTYTGTHDNPDGQNTAVGVVACGGFNTGKFNTCVGGHTLRTGGGTSIQNRSTIIGATSFLNAGAAANSGDNTGIGFATGTNISTGTFNFFGGAYAGAGLAGGYAGTNPCPNAANDVLTVTKTTLLGPCTGLGGATQVTNSFALGNEATVSASNTGVIGNSSVTDIYFGSTTPIANLHAAGLQGNTTAPAVDATSCTGATAGTGANNLAGTILGVPTGSCVVKLTFANTATSAHGWACSISDLNTANVFRQTASTTTTVTFSGTSVSGDVLVYGPCAGY